MMSSIRILLATLGLLLLPTSLIAQEFTLGFEISSSLGSVGGGIQNLTFGQQEGASDGFVDGEDVYSTAPTNSGAFHAWINIDGQNWQTCLRSPSSEDQICVIGLNFYQTNPIFLQWDSTSLPESGSYTLEDAFGGGILSVDLKQQDSLLIDNIALTSLVLRVTPPIVEMFRRGDVNGDQSFNMSDVISSLGNLFLSQSGMPITCLDAADTNDDGSFNLSDPVFGLYYLFNGGPSPLAPFQECGEDPTEDPLDCTSSCP